jgi:hypothetical protein
MSLWIIGALLQLACTGNKEASRQIDDPARSPAITPASVVSGAKVTGSDVTLASDGRIVRATGIVQALQWKSLRVPQLSGVTATGSPEITLTRLIPNGAKVSQGDILIEFDRLNLLDQERDARAKLEDLEHQLQEKKAQVESLQTTRGSEIREAQADIERAELQLRKGPVLSVLDRLKNEAKAEDAKARLESLMRSNAMRLTSEKASVRILELKLDRQSVTLERIRTNLERLVIKAPHDGMVAHENTWRQGSMGPPQVGDRMWPGMPIVRIFNPDRMVVQATVDEPDFGSVSRASRAKVFLDAYPGESFDAKLQAASPVATTGLDTPVRNFVVTFEIEQRSPNLLPDLSAALEIERTPAGEIRPTQTARVTPGAKVNP